MAQVAPVHGEEAGVKVTRGTLETNKGTAVNVAATVSGMGTVNIAATTQHLIDADQPDAVIFSGIAGNLNTNLHINDVVLGGTLRYLDTDMRLVGQFKPGTADRPIEEYHSRAPRRARRLSPAPDPCRRAR